MRRDQNHRIQNESLMTVFTPFPSLFTFEWQLIVFSLKKIENSPFFFRPWPKDLAIIVDNVPIDFCLVCRPALIISAWHKHFFVFGEV